MIVSAWIDNVGKIPQRSTTATTNLNNRPISTCLQDHNGITNAPFLGWLLSDEGQRLTDLIAVPSA
jgi:hypothetical protein